MRIQKQKLDMIRGRLITTLRRDVTWTDFAKICGLGLGTVSNLRNGRSSGSYQTIEKIVSSMREYGLPIGHQDLLG